MSVLVGYLNSRGQLFTAKGKDTGYRLHRVVAVYTTQPNYDKTEAIILGKPGKTSTRWAAGYYLNQAGDLFRGEIVGSAKHYSKQEADLIDDAAREAKNLADYWGQRDQEHEEEFQRELAEEEESSGDPRRAPKGRRRRRPKKKAARK